jgi:ATP-dependent Clp protease ATP-binding subunit ClpA
VTDRLRLGRGDETFEAARRRLAQLARDAVDAAIELIQVRERGLETARLVDLVSDLVDIARGSTTRIIVNDRLDVALACGANGVHLRSDSIAPAAARSIAPPGFLVGRSVHDVSRLGKRVVGQRKAVEALANRLVLNKGPLKDGFDRPDGVLLFLGPTGVGKTELAKASAEFLFGDDKKMIRIDMSEYQDGGVSVDKLIGMPRGIVGSERGGLLTNQLRDNPCSVVLFDEIEKASPSLLNLFLQAFDEGWLTDGRGKRVYLSDAIIIMTSNAGSEHFRKLTNPMGFRSGKMPIDQVQTDVNKELERRFPPEFRNRIDQVVLFAPLTHDEVRAIALKYIEQVSETLKRSNKTVTIEPDALEKLVTDGYSLAYGARFLKRVIDDRIKLPLSQQWKEANSFRVVLRDDQIAVEALVPRLVASADPNAIAV